MANNNKVIEFFGVSIDLIQQLDARLTEFNRQQDAQTKELAGKIAKLEKEVYFINRLLKWVIAGLTTIACGVGGTVLIRWLLK